MKNRENYEAVQRMQDYIDEHFAEPITLYQLALAAGYSPYHCARIFKELTDKTPFEYIRKLRLSKSALALWKEKVKVLDVALDSVFHSHEGFARAFSKEFGVTPKVYSKNPKPIQLFMPDSILSYYSLISKKGDRVMSEKAKTIFVKTAKRPKRKLILKRAVKATNYFEYCEEVGCDIWGVLSSIKEALYEPIGMWMPDNLRLAGTSVYTQGVEVPFDYSCELPNGYEIIELPACEILIMQGEPYDDEQFIDAVNEAMEQMAKFNPQTYGYEWADDVAPRFQLSPQGCRGYIEGRAVKKMR